MPNHDQIDVAASKNNPTIASAVNGPLLPVGAFLVRGVHPGAKRACDGLTKDISLLSNRRAQKTVDANSMFTHFHQRHDCGSRWSMSGRPGPEGGGRHAGRGMFGRHRGGPFGGRGARMFDQGALRLVVLGLIEQEPRHGYDIIKALEARFEGAYSPSPGAIYPMLQMLEEADLVVSSMAGSKRMFAISDAGRAYLAENREELERRQCAARQSLQQSEALGHRRGYPRLPHGSARQAAQRQLSAAQVEELRAILQRTRKALRRALTVRQEPASSHIQVLHRDFGAAANRWP